MYFQCEWWGTKFTILILFAITSIEGSLKGQYKQEEWLQEAKAVSWASDYCFKPHLKNGTLPFNLAPPIYFPHLKVSVRIPGLLHIAMNTKIPHLFHFLDLIISGQIEWYWALKILGQPLTKQTKKMFQNVKSSSLKLPEGKEKSYSRKRNMSLTLCPISVYDELCKFRLLRWGSHQRPLWKEACYSSFK